MLRIIAYYLVTFTVCSIANGASISDDAEFERFSGTLERYQSTSNDVIFLLDESGSIGTENYPAVKLFTELMTRLLSVSEYHSRVALVTFATEVDIPVNYISDFQGNNMCTLLKVIRGIGYAAGWTYTQLAMKAAQDIFRQAQKNSNKIIILITDGQSNGVEKPDRIAQQLKNEGVIIFAVGVAEVNVDEIRRLATSDDHIYILKNFLYIKEINKMLKQDTKEVSWDKAKDASLCSNCSAGRSCCDVNADCYCGTKGGEYECACNAGFSGNGHAGECHVCQKGTYKEAAGKWPCRACPKYSTTLHERSTSETDCMCITGYEKNGTECAPIKCALLHPPIGGVLLPTNCDNSYGSQCKFKCLHGYCPYSCNTVKSASSNDIYELAVPIQPKTCLETGKWTGDDFHCEKIKCPVLDHPLNGEHNCSNTDFGFDTTCQFTCQKGYELSGSETRTCLMNGHWTGSLTTCSVIHCDPLKINAVLKVTPAACGQANATKKLPYRSICQYYCASGYKLVSHMNENTDGINECLHDKSWSKKKLVCIDNEHPKISCPKSVTVKAELGKNRALVHWKIPEATDNVDVKHVSIIQPASVKKSPYAFPIGTTKVVYEAVDSSNLSSTCSFNIKVIDSEPPKVVFCPDDIEIFTSKNEAVPVNWIEPEFWDNSLELNVPLKNKISGDKFAWSPKPQVVSYRVSDASGNTASCNFSVLVKAYPCTYYDPPANGALTCDSWVGGRLCAVHCHEGYEPTTGPSESTTYMCNTKNKGGKSFSSWGPVPGSPPTSKVMLPWPDCVRKKNLNSIKVAMNISYTVDSCTEDMIEILKIKFIKMLMPAEKILPGMICPLKKGCIPENVKVSCGKLSSRKKRNLLFSTSTLRNSKAKLEYSFHRVRRSKKPQFVLSISISMELDSNETLDDGKLLSEEENMKHLMENASEVLKTIEETASESVKAAYNVSNISKPKLDYEIALKCSSGQMRKENICLNCPVGTFKDDLNNACKDCPIATYQDKENSLSCLPCPKYYTTTKVKSKSLNDCKAPCSPGFYSKTTFEPCLACPLNTYQKHSGRKMCTVCPDGLQTWKIGANSSTHCVSPCKSGSYSETGFEPCEYCALGFYQDQVEQKNCHPCPNDTITIDLGTTDVNQCTESDICTVIQPCSSFSTCLRTGNSYKCICPEGLVGEHCETNVDECASDPCLNNGKCTDGIGSFKCSCSEGWSGDQCEKNRNDCVSNPCQNNGVCKDLVNDYLCECETGYRGRNCEININDCASNPCYNNGTCFDMQNDYRCCCSRKYKGKNCETEIDPCEGVKCLNEGTCLSEGDEFHCVCQSGFVGKYCETNFNDCFNHQCHNGGVCVDGIDSATCKCPEMYGGTHCENALFPEFLLHFAGRSTSNYVALENLRLLYAITVAFYMRSDFKDENSRATPVSYSYQDADGIVIDNGLTLLDTNRLVLYLHGEHFYTEYSANKDNFWHHYAVTWEKMDGKWSFYVDGKLIKKGRNVGSDKYMWPGVFILGQEQDSLGSTFSTIEAFSGEISEFNVWDYALSEKEMEKIFRYCGYIGNVIPWIRALKHIHGSISISKDVEICRNNNVCSESDCHCFYANKTSEKTCTFPVDSCENQPCKNNQECVISGEETFCLCDSGYTGRNCEYDIDECLEKNGGCSNLCVNTPGSYFCTCPEGMILGLDGHECKERSFCENAQEIYLDGEKWTESCQSCACNGGNVICEDLKCEPVACQPEEEMVTLPGHCCPECVFWSFCLASSNNTIVNFNMNELKLQENCTYTLLEDCVEGRFKVRFESVSDGAMEMKLAVYHGCHTIRILNLDSLLVDDESVSLPLYFDSLSIERQNTSIAIFTDAGLHVQWHSFGEALLSVPVQNSGALCGLCGNLEKHNTSDSVKYFSSDRTASEETNCYAYREELESKDKQSLKNASSHQKDFSSYLLCLLLCFITNIRLQKFANTN